MDLEIKRRVKGRPKSIEERKKLIGVYLDKVTRERLKEIAEIQKRSVSSQAEYILEQWLQQYNANN